MHTNMGRLLKNAKDSFTSEDLDKYFSKEEEHPRGLLALQIALFESSQLFILDVAVVAQM